MANPRGEVFEVIRTDATTKPEVRDFQRGDCGEGQGRLRHVLLNRWNMAQTWCRRQRRFWKRFMET